MAQKKQYSFKGDDSKSTTIIIGILLVLIIIVGVSLIFVLLQKPAGPNLPPPVSNITNQTGTTTNQTNATCDDTCLYANALGSRDYLDCQKISNASLVQRCYGELSSTSLGACKALADEPARRSCINAFALAAKDITLCDLLTSGKDECRYAVNPCLKASDKNLCEALQGNDTSKCNSNQDCLLNYSVTRQNASVCGLIQNAVASKACESAVRRTDRCSSFSIQAERDLCYQLYATYTDDYLTCTSISLDSRYMLDCLSLFAARKGDISICNQDGLSLDTLWACYRNYSLLTGDASGCDKIDPLASTNRFDCAFSVAKKYGNPAACDLITDSLTQRSTCYEGVMLYNNDTLINWSYCGDVINYNWKNKCFGQAAIQYDLPSLCDYISDASGKQTCQIAYNASKNKP